MEHNNDSQHPIPPWNGNKQCKIPILRVLRNFCRRNATPRVPNTNAMPVVVPSSSEPQMVHLPVQSHMFQSAQKVDIGGNAQLTNIAGTKVTNVINHWHDGTHGLEEMKIFVSFSAQFDSSAQDPERVCHPGTRQNVLKRIQDWIDNPNSTERIFWLYGPAGAGKSAIAQTIAQSCSRQKVAATFFFYRSDANRNDGNRLFTTLAYQLAFSVPSSKDYIVQSLHGRPDLPTKSVETQFEHLIALPFRALAEAASHPSSPAGITNAVNQCQQLSPVIIIDGVDECMEEKLQQRFLKIIGNAVKDRSFPFRFLICSRPEAHIEDTLKQFKALILSTDLAKLDDANRDIEKYLLDEFARIASKWGLNSTWPGRAVIQDIIYKSSGNFIFASVVVKFISDEDNSPESQLAIVLKLKPPGQMTPFALLDELYLEILRRQPDQDFLKTSLALLVGRIALSSGGNLQKDDAILMNVSEEELHAKLRKMRSLLKFEPSISVHHQSFLDFLNEPSRSGKYYVSKRGGERRYVDLVVDSIVRYVSRVIEDSDYHEVYHLNLNFNTIIKWYPLKINLPTEKLQDALQPLVRIQDEILKLGDSPLARNLLSCDKCTAFDIMRRLLLHLAFDRCIDVTYNEVEESVAKREYSDAMPSISIEAMENALGNDLNSSLSSLLTLLQETKLELSPNATLINHIYTILRFDCAEIVMKVRSISDAQKLVDLLVYLIDERYILSQYKADAMSKVAQLVLNFFFRIPILPRSLLLNVERITSGTKDSGAGIKSRCKAALAWRVLDRNYIHLEMKVQKHSLVIPFKNLLRFAECQQQASTLSSITVIEVVLEVARAIQYLHSMGVSPMNFDAGDVYFDLSRRPKTRISVQFLGLIDSFTGSTSEGSLYEQTVFGFGCFFYQMYFNTKIGHAISIEDRRQIVVARPSSPKITEYAWQLIQRCCAEDPRDRPTIDEIVDEMDTCRDQPK